MTRADVPFIVLALVTGALLLYLGRSLTFWYDEWRSITFDGGFVDYFRPVNEHWSTVPLALYRATFEVVELRSYLPYLAQVIVLHLVAVSGRVRPHASARRPVRRDAAGAAVAAARSRSGESLLGVPDRVRRIRGVRRVGARVHRAAGRALERSSRLPCWSARSCRRESGSSSSSRSRVEPLVDRVFRPRVLARRRARRRLSRVARRPGPRCRRDAGDLADPVSVDPLRAAWHRLLGRGDGRPRPAPDGRRRRGAVFALSVCDRRSTNASRAARRGSRSAACSASHRCMR